MAKNVVEGKLFTASNNGIELLGMALSRSGSSWILDNWIQVRAEPVSGEVESVIRADMHAGQAERIDHVLVSPRVFNILYVEGKISLEQMATSVEDEEEMSVTVQGVQLADGEYTVKTMPEDAIKARYGDASFATIDANGEIV